MAPPHLQKKRKTSTPRSPAEFKSRKKLIVCSEPKASTASESRARTIEYLEKTYGPTPACLFDSDDFADRIKGAFDSLESDIPEQRISIFPEWVRNSPSIPSYERYVLAEKDMGFLDLAKVIYLTIHQESGCRDLVCFETYRKALDSGDAAAAGHSSSVKRRAVPLGIERTILRAEGIAALYSTLRFRIGDTQGLSESDIISAFESALYTYLDIEDKRPQSKILETPASEPRIHQPRLAQTEAKKSEIISAFGSALQSHLGVNPSKKSHSQEPEIIATAPPVQEPQSVQPESEGDDSNQPAASESEAYELKCGSKTEMVSEEAYNRLSTSPEFLRMKKAAEEAEARLEAQRQAAQRSFDEWEASRQRMMELAARDAHRQAQFRATLAECDAAGILPLVWQADAFDLQTLPILSAQSVFIPKKWDFRTINLAFGFPILLSTSTQFHLALRSDPWSLSPLDDIADMLVWLNYFFDLLGTVGVPEWVMLPVLVASIWLMGGFEWLPTGGCSPVPLLLNGGQWLFMILMDNGGASVGVVALGFFLWLVFLGLIML